MKRRLHMKEVTQKLLLLSLCGLILITLVIPLFVNFASQKAYAGGFTGQWVDQNTIIIGPASKHATYSVDASGNYIYYAPAPTDFPTTGPSMCPNEIVVTSDPANPNSKGMLSLDHWVKINVGKTFRYECKSEYGGAAQPITLTNTANATLPPGAVGGPPPVTPNLNLVCKTGTILGFIPNPLDWALCGIINGMNLIVSGLDDQIMTMLSIGTKNTSTDDPNQIFADSNGSCGQSYTDSGGTVRPICDSYYTAWQSFRNIALGLLVIVGLIIVISQAMGMEILDAYTIRKMLPRVLIATVAITLSWQLMRFLVILSNDLGYGVESLISAPFSKLGINIHLGAAHDLLAGLAVAVGAAVFDLFGLLAFVGTAALAVLITFLVLILRQIAVILLIIFSPIALIAYVLPNTQRVYKFWWESFSKMLMMFPMIVAFITAGHIFAAISSNSPDFIHQTIALFAYFAPYFMIPLTFKFSGAMMGTIGNAVNARGEGARGALRNFRSNRAKKNVADLASGQRLNEDITTLGYNKFAEKFNRGTSGAANLKNAGFNPYQMKNRMTAARSTRSFDEAQKALAEDTDVKAAYMDDDIAEASMSKVESYKGSGHFGGNTDESVRQFLMDRGYTAESGLEEKVALARAARRKLSPHAQEIAAWTGNWKTGTGFSEKKVMDQNGVEHETGGAGQAMIALADMTQASNGGDHMRARMLAASREAATGQRRSDWYGQSFTEQTLLARKVAGPGHGGMDADDISEVVRKGATWGKSRGEHVTGRPQAIKAIVPQLKANFDQILANPIDPATGKGKGTVTELMQELGQAAAGQQAAGQASKENATEHAKYMNHEIDLRNLPAGIDSGVRDAIYKAAQFKGRATGNPETKVTVQDMLDANRGDRELTAMVYQYGNKFAEDASAAARNAAAAGTQPQQPFQPSDRRLKSNIQQLGYVADDIPLYRFNYTYDEQTTYVGVIAQDLLETHPYAVYLSPDGYYMVDYEVLGLEMMTLEEWQTENDKHPLALRHK